MNIRKQCKLIDKLIAKEKLHNITPKKMLCYYCAFAPYIALAIAIILCKFTTFNLWKLGFIEGIICLPVTFILVLATIYKPKSEKIAITAATLLINAHLMFYLHVGYITLQDNANEESFIITLMISLIAAGVGLLLLIDNEKEIGEIK